MPILRWEILLIETELGILIQVDGICPHLVAIVETDGGDHAFVDGTGKDKAPIVIGMFTNQVDASRRGVYFGIILTKFILENLNDFFFFIDSYFT